MPFHDHELLPLSPEQRAASTVGEALWLKASMRGPLDEARIRQALIETAERHESLRTAYHSVPGYRELRQEVLAVAPHLEWTTIDGRGMPDFEAFLRDRLRKEALRPFDLAQGQVLRALLLRVADDDAQLVLMVSPLAADSGSVLMIFGEMMRRYVGDAVEPEVFQYTRFVEWREAVEADADSEDGKHYWAGLGLEALAAPRLPYLRARGAAMSLLNSFGQGVDDSASDALFSWSTARETELETVLQAAWWALLARIGGEGSFAGAWQHDCRRDYESMAASIGVYDKQLPVPLNIDVSQPWSQWLPALDELLHAHRSWQEAYVLADANAPWRIGFACATLPAPFERDGLQAEVLDWSGIMPGFELALQPLLDSQGRLARVVLHFDASRCDKEAASCLLDQYLALISTLPQHADRSIAELPLVDTGAPVDHWLLEGAPIEPAGESLPVQLSRQAASTPHAMALVGQGQHLSYAELDQRVEVLAQALAARGVGAETIVALLLQRSTQLVVALLAVQRAGGAYLPLDPTWPVARQQQILADAKPLLLLCEDDAAIASIPVPAVTLRTLEAERPLDAIALARISPQQAAYLLYTSGSTGEPKGVLIEHAQLLNYVTAVSRALQLHTCRRFALTSTVAADLGNTTLFGAFHHGGCLIVADAADLQDPASFARFIQREGIDCMKIVPSHVAALLDAEAAVLPRTLVLGGEATPRALVERITALSADCRIFNHYGPTETTVGVLTHAVRPGAPWHGDTLPLSQALAGCRVMLLDAALRPVPTGAIGELYIGGAQLCRGILNRPLGGGFIDDPFRPGERLYRTGDLGRRLPNGHLMLAGRVDDELKIRGFRIAPAEVEAALLSVPGVRQAAVRAWGDGDARQLCAYVVDEQARDAGELLAALRELLPEPMLPAQLRRLPDLPRLPNGKVNRRDLPEPTDAPRAMVEPRDDVEAVLADLCAELLGRERISVFDSFFALGGHSLLVIKLVARIRKQLQVEIAPGVVFDHSSVAALAKALRARESMVGQVDKVAGLRRQLAQLTPHQKAALVDRARETNSTTSA